MTKNNQKIIFRLIPIMLTFFAMGFVDLVGIASNYVKADFGLSDSLTNLLPRNSMTRSSLSSTFAMSKRSGVFAINPVSQSPAAKVG